MRGPRAICVPPVLVRTPTAAQLEGCPPLARALSRPFSVCASERPGISLYAVGRALSETNPAATVEYQKNIFRSVIPERAVTPVISPQLRQP
jgi:hypothetical protein